MGEEAEELLTQQIIDRSLARLLLLLHSFPFSFTCPFDESDGAVGLAPIIDYYLRHTHTPI